MSPLTQTVILLLVTLLVAACAGYAVHRYPALTAPFAAATAAVTLVLACVSTIGIH